MDKKPLSKDAFFWILSAMCAVHRKPFSIELAQQQLTAPYTPHALERAAKVYGFDASWRKTAINQLHKESFPLIAWQQVNHSDSNFNATNEIILPTLVLQADSESILCIKPGDNAPEKLALTQFQQHYIGHITRVTPQAETATDPDSEAEARQLRKFGFSWFIPELLKHKKLWQEILLASLVIQLIALGTPLFTQTIIDKVITHHAQSTLIVIAIGIMLFTLFSAVLSWLRQYLVLHTGNRIDAALGAAVFERLFKLPPMYFQHRPTGVIAARLHGVETIREFIASAAVTLVLDLPFLLIFVAIMFYYSVVLTLIVLGILALIVILSLLVGPAFQARLQQQFLFGARNQAFLTEYIAGLETVKSLQLEPQLTNKYSHYLASYLQAGFATKQLANGYNTAANLLEQLMSLLILGIGAYTVMNSMEFTIGMLVAFQMFAGKLSQPMLRLVGLWQQFQQASLSVARLGDLMNVPTEPYSVLSSRDKERAGTIAIENLAFKYAEHLPLVYQNLDLHVQAGQTIAIMGPSGCGKSTLAKLLQGFYSASAGRILIDGIDIRYLSANELRGYFGVVPQETVLFSGTIYDNLQMANPHASFDDIIDACKMAEVHDVIEAQPQGYQTEIGERGAGLSGGQKQRIAIARALLKHPSILIFDEATSALDEATAEHFAATINGLKGKATMLFITHAIPKGLAVDAIFRLDQHSVQPGNASLTN